MGEGVWEDIPYTIMSDCTNVLNISECKANRTLHHMQIKGNLNTSDFTPVKNQKFIKLDTNSMLSLIQPFLEKVDANPKSGGLIGFGIDNPDLIDTGTLLPVGFIRIHCTGGGYPPRDRNGMSLVVLTISGDRYNDKTKPWTSLKFIIREHDSTSFGIKYMESNIQWDLNWY